MGKRTTITENKDPDEAIIMLATIEALNEMGGSAYAIAIRNKVVEIEEFTEEELSFVNSIPQKRINYRTRWARQQLKLGGALIYDESNKLWTLTKKGKNIKDLTTCKNIRKGYYGDEPLIPENPIFSDDKHAEEEIKRMLNSAKSRVVRSGGLVIRKPKELMISIDKEFLYNKWLEYRDKCALCNRNMDWKFHHPLLKPSIDRINSKLPYKGSNVGIVHLACNLGKRDATVDQFNEYLKEIRR